MSYLTQLMSANFLDIPSTFICEDCGEEIPSGLLNHIKHESVCLRNAPNCDIHNHLLKIESEAWMKQAKIRQEQEEKEFEVIWAKMSVDERARTFFKAMCRHVGSSE